MKLSSCYMNAFCGTELTKVKRVGLPDKANQFKPSNLKTKNDNIRFDKYSAILQLNLGYNLIKFNGTSPFSLIGCNLN